MNNYYYDFLKKKFGGNRSWRLTDTTSFPICCTSETHRCTVCTIDFKDKHYFVEITKDGEIEDIKEFLTLKAKIQREEKKISKENQILHKNLDIGNKLQKHKFVRLTWPSKKDGLLDSIEFKNFTIDFQNDLIKLLKKYENPSRKLRRN